LKWLNKTFKNTQYFKTIMKHTLKITLILGLIFFISQIVGLAITNEYIDHKATAEKKEPVHKDLPFKMERPEVEGTGGMAVILIVATIIVGTLLLLLIIKFGGLTLWKIWFFIAITTCLTIAFSPFISKLLIILALILPQILSVPYLASLIALVAAVVVAILKIFRPMMAVQNIAELFIYGGISAIFISLFKNPQFGVLWAFLLLLIVSVYDIIAVWKTKHMVTLAKFQTKSQVFAGLFVPYKRVAKTKKAGAKKVPVQTAVLGGGDIAFPLLFSGAVMQKLMITNPEWLGFLKTLVLPVFTTIALLALLWISKKDKFYPAMPFLTAGCLVGYLVLLVF